MVLFFLFIACYFFYCLLPTSFLLVVAPFYKLTFYMLGLRGQLGHQCHVSRSENCDEDHCFGQLLTRGRHILELGTTSKV